MTVWSIGLWLTVAGGPAPAAEWSPLPDTGQTTCYDDVYDENNVLIHETPCPGKGGVLSGQDGQYRGAVPSYTALTVNGDGVVKDNNTLLIWQQDTADTNDDGMIDSNDQLAWSTAGNYCDGLDNFGGSSDWRLPDSVELESIVDYNRYKPAINPVFTCESYAYWSATPEALQPLVKAWAVYFDYGPVLWYDQTATYYVRCVRDGP